MSVRATNILLSKHFAHTSDFVDDFLFLTDANEWTHSEKYEIAFWKYTCPSHLQVTHSVTSARRRKVANKIAGVKHP